MKTLLLTSLIFFAFATVKGQTIQSSNYGTTGYIKSDGTIQNSSYSTIGYAKGVRKEWAAVALFFFRFN
jgi:hypothetical protein